MSIRSGICVQLFAIGLTATAAHATSVTWTLQDLGPFASGQTASGFFTIDQSLGVVTDFDIRIAGGSNPLLTNLTFVPAAGCPAFCASPILPFHGAADETGIQFRTPTAAGNEFNEFTIGFRSSVTELISGRPSELAVLLPTEFPTSVEAAVYHPEGNFISGGPQDLLSAAARRARVTSSVTEEAVPEPSYTVGLGVLCGVLLLRSRRRSA